MTTVWASLPNLQQELRTVLETISLDARKDISFRYRTERDGSDIRDDTGRPRLFQFGDPVVKGYQYVGAGSVGTERLLPIEIVYPTSGAWSEVVESDYSRLRQHLITNTTSVTGVQLRVMHLGSPIIRENLQDGYHLVTFMVYVLFDES